MHNQTLFETIKAKRDGLSSYIRRIFNLLKAIKYKHLTYLSKLLPQIERERKEK